MLFINRLAKVADDPTVQGADPVNIFGVAVTRIVGIARPASMRWRQSSIPVIAGMFTSAIRQAGIWAMSAIGQIPLKKPSSIPSDGEARSVSEKAAFDECARHLRGPRP
jgi:hypothetical protein